MKNYTVTFIDTSDDHAVSVAVPARDGDSAVTKARRVLKIHGYGPELPLYGVRKHAAGSL